MNKNFSYLLIIIICLLPVHKICAQTKAIDENGHQVLLFSDGTWKYDVDSLNKNDAPADSIKINTEIFNKPPANNFLIKSNIINVGVYFNTSKWTVKPHSGNELIPEYRFDAKSSDLYAMLIAERTPIDISQMRDIALINAQKAAPNAKITNSEYRTVNGLKVLCLEITGTIKGINFKYLGYYYSNENGTVQLLTYTSQNLFKESYKDMEDFLNGLIEIQK